MDLESILDFKRDLDNDLVRLGLEIGRLEEDIKPLQIQKIAIESELSELKVHRDQALSTSTYGQAGKVEITARVECRTDSAASLVLTLLRELSDQDCYDFMRHVIGVVALLGTAPTLELSRILAEYLGDQMLAVVCKSYKDVRLLETYENNGKLNHAHAFHMFSAELGQSINGRYHVLCIEDIRPCEVGKDLHGRLLLPNPTLPDGTTPAGFLGYAVNMMDIDVDHIDARTDSDSGVRETLFYRLFGEAHVYETREEMKSAISCIKDGAVSLDGGILRGNGVVSLGCWQPDIIFPVASAKNQVLSQHPNNVLNQYDELRLKHKQTWPSWMIKRNH